MSESRDNVQQSALRARAEHIRKLEAENRRLLEENRKLVRKIINMEREDRP